MSDSKRCSYCGRSARDAQHCWSLRDRALSSLYCSIVAGCDYRFLSAQLAHVAAGRYECVWGAL